MILRQLNHRSGDYNNYDQEQLLQFVNQMLLPDKAENETNETLKYTEEHRIKSGKMQDERIPLLKEWLNNLLVQIPGLDERAHRSLVMTATPFFMSEDG